MQKNRWLLLRGLARGVGHWGSFAQMIQGRFPDDEFLFIELPGNGDRCNEASPLDISDYVEDLRRRCGWVEEGLSFQVLSVSLGAMITVEWMKQHPEDISKAYLVCTSSASDAKFYERFRAINLVKSVNLLRAKNDDELWERTILSMVANSHERKEEELPALREVTRNYPQKTTNTLRQLFAASKYSFPAQAPGDVKLIGSYGDKLVAPECTLTIAQKWGLEAVMHPWAGHDIAIDDPHWLIEQLL